MSNETKLLCVKVLESWRVILRGAPMDISLADVRVCARDGAAFVTCTELMEVGDSRGRHVPVPSTFSLACQLSMFPSMTSFLHILFSSPCCHASASLECSHHGLPLSAEHLGCVHVTSHAMEVSMLAPS